MHRVFGASNVGKLLQELPPPTREDAVNSLAYEADARIHDPVYGCVGALFALQQQVQGHRAGCLHAPTSALLRGIFAIFLDCPRSPHRSIASLMGLLNPLPPMCL